MLAWLRRSSLPRRLLLCLLVPLLVVLLPGSAVAAPAPGSQVYTWTAAPSWKLQIDCGSDPKCLGPGSYTLDAAGVPDDSQSTLIVSNVDPRQLLSGCWPRCQYQQFVGMGGPSVRMVHEMVRNPARTQWTYSAPEELRVGTAWRWAFTFAVVPAATPITVSTLWEFPDMPPPAEPTPTPTPTPTEDPEPTDPPTEPTDPPTVPGSVCGLTAESRCYVEVIAQPPVSVEVGDVQVSGLTDEQWTQLQLALATLCMFVVGGFVASWRHGRGS